MFEIASQPGLTLVWLHPLRWRSHFAHVEETQVVSFKKLFLIWFNGENIILETECYVCVVFCSAPLWTLPAVAWCFFLTLVAWPTFCFHKNYSNIIIMNYGHIKYSFRKSFLVFVVTYAKVDIEKILTKSFYCLPKVF